MGLMRGRCISRRAEAPDSIQEDDDDDDDKAAQPNTRLSKNNNQCITVTGWDSP